MPCTTHSHLLIAHMNRYPLWKYLIVAFALVIGFIYTLPNFFGESPAVQVSSTKATIKVDAKWITIGSGV